MYLMFFTIRINFAQIREESTLKVYFSHFIRCCPYYRAGF